MKNSYIKIPIVLLVSLIVSCCENFTEVDPPTSQLTASAVFENSNTATAALSDIYAGMRDNGITSGSIFGVSYLMGNYSDELLFNGNSVDIIAINTHAHGASNSLILSMWNNGYAHIYAANSFIEGIDNSSAITAEERERFKGEALFIRAYIHFYLVNLFGDVPYVNTTDYVVNTTISRTPQAEVWQLILSDLKEAELLIPESYLGSGRVRVNKSTVKALMSRVYLYTENWLLAEEEASNVINLGEYSIVPDLNEVFLKESPEAIWSLHTGYDGANTVDGRTFTFNSGPPIKPYFSPSLLNAFEPGDARKEMWVRTVSNGTDFWSHAFKYKRSSYTETSEEYTILFRLAEQYLIRAEARAHLGNIEAGRQDLNVIRTRATLPPTTADTKEELLTAILNERQVELFTEQGHRWFDLKRTGKANEVIGAVKSQWQSTQILLPLPEQEILLNQNLSPQNPGY